jgi:hypothetical protein
MFNASGHATDKVGFYDLTQLFIIYLSGFSLRSEPDLQIHNGIGKVGEANCREE